jgi:allophanate hydrolase
MKAIESLAFTIPELHAAYRDGLSPADLAAEVLARIALADDPGIFISLASENVLKAEAKALGAFDPKTKPLFGIPIAVKDNIDVAGLPTTAACPDFSHTPERDAEVVVRLRQAGALIIGKTNLDQFATGLVGVRTPYPVPKNACDPALVPGGSSSGSAIAVARGLVAAALGTDTAGSGRVPAALNNIVGLKPSLGLVSNRGVVPACRTLDCVSVLSLTVADAWSVLQAIAHYDAADPFSRPVPSPAYQPRPPSFSVGVPAEEDRIFGDDAARRAFSGALDQIEALGAAIVPVPFADFFAVAALLYEGAWVAERYAAIKEMIEERPESLHPVTRQIIGGAASLSASAAFEGIYKLKELQRKIEPVWASIDLLCVPSIPAPCTLAEVEADPIGANSRLGTYTNFVNLLDLSAITVPAGKRSDGLPNSVTLIGRSGDDGRLAGIASDLHSATTEVLGATGWPLERRAFPEACSADRIEVAVVGAHLSGMPLNGELLALGGIFSRVVRTAPEYRLYALDTTPAKPGLHRCSPAEGETIEAEVWSLSPEGFGRFVAEIAPPLSIGSLKLDDGSLVKGFLAEAEALSGAPDISRFGGWRAYVESRSVLSAALA